MGETCKNPCEKNGYHPSYDSEIRKRSLKNHLILTINFNTIVLKYIISCVHKQFENRKPLSFRAVLLSKLFKNNTCMKLLCPCSNDLKTLGLCSIFEYSGMCVISFVSCQQFLSCYRLSPYVCIQDLCYVCVLKLFIFVHCAMLCLIVYCELLPSTSVILLYRKSKYCLQFLVHNLICFAMFEYLFYRAIVLTSDD